VIDEASAAAERLKLLDGLPIVRINDDVRYLARAIVAASIMPPKAAPTHFTLPLPPSRAYNTF
jgi:hypothetical protein